jgi:hypothetical protein
MKKEVLGERVFSLFILWWCKVVKISFKNGSMDLKNSPEKPEGARVNLILVDLLSFSVVF